MKRIAPLALLALTACGSTIVQERPVTVSVPVAQPCAGERPERPSSLVSRTPAWNQMDVRQKAAAVGAWALDLLSYGEKLEAATAACP